MGKTLVNSLYERSMIRKLGKDNTCCGSSMQPWKLLFLKTKTRSPGKVPNHSGKVSLNLLFPRSRTSNCLHRAKDRGNRPSRRFPFKLRFLNLFPSTKCSGTWPWKLFNPRFKTDNSVKFAKHSGIVPVNVLLDKSMI